MGIWDQSSQFSGKTTGVWYPAPATVVVGQHLGGTSDWHCKDAQRSPSHSTELLLNPLKLLASFTRQLVCSVWSISLSYILNSFMVYVVLEAPLELALGALFNPWFSDENTDAGLCYPGTFLNGASWLQRSRIRTLPGQWLLVFALSQS